MKNLFVTCALFLGLAIGHSHAQGLGKASDALKQEMQKLSYFVGKWKGEAIAKQRNGPDTKVIQEENIQFKLDNTLLLIEGTGRNPENLSEIVFNALAVVNYDEPSKAFKFRSHLKDGKQTDAYFKIMGENHFEWGFDVQNNAKIRYDIKLDPTAKSWNEIGEYSPDGVTWYPFIELKLTKLD
jgi:hypothetical protein